MIEVVLSGWSSLGFLYFMCLKQKRKISIVRYGLGYDLSIMLFHAKDKTKVLEIQVRASYACNNNETHPSKSKTMNQRASERNEAK